MEKTTKIIFKIALIMAVFFCQVQLVVIFSILYFPLVYAAAYLDNKFPETIKVGTGVATGRAIGLVRINGILTACYL